MPTTPFSRCHMLTLVCFLLVSLPICLSGQSLPPPIHPLAQAELLSVMQGHTTYRESHWWIRVSHPGTVTLAYWPAHRPDSVRYAEAQARDADFPMVTLTATLLQPGMSYEGEIRWNREAFDNGMISFETPEIWQFRRDPPPFRLAMGSCTYINESGYDRPGSSYGGDYSIFNAIMTSKPDAMFWLGDNTYLRDPDFSSRSGMWHRYDHTRQTVEMQPLLRSVPNYAIWDDHDYGPNDSDRSWVFKEHALELFAAFWPNPSIGAAGLRGAISRFTWHDVDIIMLDNRWYRSPNDLQGETRHILGEAQEDWLIESLVGSRTPFKLVLVGGQLITDAPVYETWINIAPEERERILKRIDENGVSGVVFVSGDRHHSEASRIELPGGTVVHDITVSPLTSAAHRQSGEPNSHRVAGSLLEQRNFALFDVSGPRKERVLQISYRDTAGQPLWDMSIPAAP